MTKENMLELLPRGKTLEQCKGECEVETGRLLGASYVLTAKITRIGTGLRLMVKLHDTKTGTLMASEQFSGEDEAEIEKDILRADAPDIFFPLVQQSTVRVAARPDSVLGASSKEWDPAWDKEQVAVEFSSLPAGAVVEIDGVPVCTTPCSRQVATGRHAIALKIPRYLPLIEDVELKKGQKPFVRTLVPNFGKVNVVTTPGDLEVVLDGKVIGKSPIVEFEVDPGWHAIVARGQQYFEKGAEFSIGRGETKPIAITLVGRYGGVSIAVKDSKGNDVSAAVSIDGVSIGDSPLQHKLLIGQHLIGASKQGEVAEKSVTIQEKEIATVTLALQNTGSLAAQHRPDSQEDKFVCGKTAKTMVKKIANCLVTGSTAKRVGWSLITRYSAKIKDGKPCDATCKEVWRDDSSGLIWSDLITDQITTEFNWCQASGSKAESYCDEARYQSQARPVSLCVEAADLSAPIFGDGAKGAVKLGTIPSLRWTLPTKEDWELAEAHGVRGVLPNLAEGGFWSSSVSSGSRGNAWYFYSYNGSVSNGNRNFTNGVRCVARPAG
jgi:hypothetical protein